MRSRLVSFALALAALLLAGAAFAALSPASYSGRGFAPVGDTWLFYEVKGAGEPVVLIHGGQLDSRMWDEQFDSYAREFRVLRYDIRGFGGSPVTRAVYSNAEDLAALLDYLAIPKAHLIGLSLGGMVATDFALTHPGRVLSLVLSGPGVTGLNAETEEENARYLAEVRAARDLPPDEGVKPWLADPLLAPAMEHPELAPRLERLACENLHAWTTNWQLQRIPRPVPATRLRDIKAPTLLIVGDRDLPSSFTVIDTLAKAITGSRKVFIPGAGHMVNMEKPAEFDRAVLGFLRGLKKR